MNQILRSYLADAAARGFSVSIRKNMIYAVEWLILYLVERYGIEDWRDVRAEHLDDFALHIRRDHRTRLGKPLKNSTINHVLSRLRVFFEWQTERGLLLYNPAEGLALVALERPLPHVLSEKQITRLIETPNTEKATGLRDRALMETLYATGIRHAEAFDLNLYDADLAAKRLTIRQGKNSRDRIVPLTENAVFWITKYLSSARPELARKAYSQRAQRRGEVVPTPSAALWLSNNGTRLSYSWIDQLISKYAQQAGVKANVHTFRHSCATHLLRGGASTRHIQKLLGHNDLQSTQIYMHLEVTDLKQVVARLRRKGASAD